MKFGLALPYNQANLTVEWARQAEAAGWDGCFLGDAVWTVDLMVDAGATWWIEEMFAASADEVGERIRQGPPALA